MKEKSLLRQACVSLIITAVLYLFYNTIFVFAALPFVWWLCRKYMKKEEEKRRRDNLNIQFKDMLISMTAAMRVGYSVENALKEARSEMVVTYGAGSDIVSEIEIMLNQLKVGVSAEEIFEDFALRSKVEDIATFAAVFKIARRSGGDMVEIMRKTSADISAKVDTRNEIQVLISAKRLEQNIMMMMPAGIIVYMRVSSDGLLDSLYGNAAGVLIMTLCLGLYVLAWYMGRKITDISV